MALAIATQAQANKFRNDIGGNQQTFSDYEIDEIYGMAVAQYGDSTSLVTELYVRIIALKRLLMQATKLTTYTQNASSENLSDIAKNLQNMLKMYQADLDAQPNPVGSVARFGSMRRVPHIRKERPDA